MTAARATVSKRERLEREMLEQARFAMVGAALSILFLLLIHYRYSPQGSPQGSIGVVQQGYLSLAAIPSAFVLSFRARPREKLFGIVVSSAVLGLATFTRLLALSFVRANFSLSFAEVLDDVSTILLLVLALALFVLWADWVSEAGQAKAKAA